MSLESSIADLVRATTDLTATVRGKTVEIDGKVAAKISEMEVWKNGHLSEHGFIAVNYNARMTRVSGEAPQQVPIAMGLNAGGDFFSKFDLKIIPVVGGVDPATRPPVVRELLQYMGCDRHNFTAEFNIVELTVKSIAKGFGDYVFYIPYRHIKTGAFHSCVMYHKLVGTADWGWMDNRFKGAWHQVTQHQFTPGDAGGYFHVDVGVTNASVGDKLYLALPQVVVGKWNPELRIPPLFNIYDMILNAVPSALPSV
ncbi:hypothetical protein NK214_06280 [Chromobacterium sp. S0633]|uniref:hypothetical protein n=1 Tax=Chromobacterium sp. S0633 TaxID=2957805 RepID=UPI00209DB153|nr:hypothetical protein [Chromobacterium sp. S0633]MCP1289795.1 hypothetical protein [Chromobacterium sp. S0633]